MSEDADDPDADEHLPEPREDDGEGDVDADLPERDADADGSADADLPERDAEAVESADANLPERDAEAVESADADLPERDTDAAGSADGDTLSPAEERETDRLPDTEGDVDGPSAASGSPGTADADTTTDDTSGTPPGERSVSPGDETDEREGSDEAAERDGSDEAAECEAGATGEDEAAVAGRADHEDTAAEEDAPTEAEPGGRGGTEPSEDSTPATPFGGLTGLAGSTTEERPGEDFEEGDLPPGDLDRAFSILEEAFTSDAFGGQQLDQLLTVFEEALTGDGETDPEAVMELIAMLEQLIVEPDDLAEVDIGGFLSIFEEAISGSTGVSEEDIADVFDVVEEGLRDPTSIDPEDVERFRTGVESAIMDMTDPSSGGFGGLFALPGMFAEETAQAGEADDEAVDMFRIARIAAGMTQRATGYSMETGVRTGTRMAYAAANSQSPAALLTNARAIALDELQRAGIDIGDEQADWLDTHEEDLVHPRPVTREALQERGEALLRESAEIGLDESIHPSYPMILDELASDEARILRLLATEGPQGVVDVYERKYIPFTLTLVARNLSMLGADAGCREKQQTPIYVENLQRLGLVAVRDTPIDDLKRYQVIQAQPHVEAARDSVKRAKTKYKSVELTNFGMEFCRICFPFPVVDETAYDTFRSEGNE